MAIILKLMVISGTMTKLLGAKYNDIDLRLPERYQLPVDYFDKTADSITGCYAILDSQEVVGFEWGLGSQVVFWSLEQNLWPGLRVGTFPPKSWDEDFTRAIAAPVTM